MAVFAAAALPLAPVVAQTLPPLPIFSLCSQSTAPALPERWRAVGLLSPFQREQLDVGEFVYDDTLPAMRATVYGLESGAVDLLITANRTYLLSGPHAAPTACAGLGRTYSLPSPSLMPKQAVCIGEVPLAAQPLEWWKARNADGRGKWYMFKSKTRLPWRIVLPAPASDPAVIGDYAMTHFPKFERLAKTDLKTLRDFCLSRAEKAAPRLMAAKTARALMASDDKAAAAEREQRIAALLPGLSRKACARMTPVRWPDRFFMTATITPIQYKWAPLPSVIYYDWSKHKTQVAIMHVPWARPPVRTIIAVLKERVGYSIHRLPNGRAQCLPQNPGLVRPDWMAAAGCECRGVLDHEADLSPNDVTQILACPIKAQGRRVMWNWYTTAGRPVLFIEPGANGAGVNIADYRDWRPGQEMPAADYALPKLCHNPRDIGLPASATVSCMDCHTTRN